MQKSKLKTMLICFFDQEGIVHREFVPPGMTVNADFYCDVLRRLRESVRCKRPQKWQNQNLIIHHDNALAYRSFKVSQQGSILKVMAESNIQGKQTSFYKYCPGTFGYILVFIQP